jgi:uncharacterized repeat protein (TIGR02543 family)
VTSTRHIAPMIKPLWLSTWPCWALLVFAGLAAMRFPEGGYARATGAAAILLVVPGSLTLAAVFSRRRRPRGLVFVCYATLLSAIWSAFASLGLYAAGELITAESTYWCLLAVSAALAVAAEARLLLERPGRGRRAARRLEALNQSGDQADDVETPAGASGAGYYSIVAVVAGVCLLAGGLYTYDHLPHPARPGYTWIAWTGSPIEGDIAIGSTGKNLSFQIVHHQRDTTTFKLSAVWQGNPSTSLAKPITFSIGPNQTFQGTLFIPALPNGCTYRILVALTAAQQIDPLRKKPQTWSINADLYDPSKPKKACK